MNLNHSTALTLWPKSPFQFDATVHKPSHFPNNLKLNDWEPDRYWQSFRFGKQLYGLKLTNEGTKVALAGKELWAIWLPEELEQVSEQDMRDLKIGYRAKFLKRLSADFASVTIDERALRSRSTADAHAQLLKLYGVGPETARILLFEAYHHYDVFDHIAPWQQKIYSRLFCDEQLVSTERIREDVLKQYGTYAMLAEHYIWEDVFWRQQHEHIDWLEKEIRL